jgi:hypothetical protein
MAKHMRIMWVAGAILLAVGGSAFASNMGFKLVPNLALADPQVYEISIPANNNYTDLKSIFDDISSNCPAGAASVSHIRTDQTACTWTGPFSCPPEPLPGCFGVRVSVTDSGGGAGCGSWIIVGSANPSQICSFPLADPQIYEDSVPYHTTQTNTAGLFGEISNAAEVCKVRTDGTANCWTGPFSTTPDPIVIGEGYIISVSNAGTTWVPSHY